MDGGLGRTWKQLKGQDKKEKQREYVEICVEQGNASWNALEIVQAFTQEYWDLELNEKASIHVATA